MEIILALDVGSSSTRCSAYRLVQDNDSNGTTEIQAMADCSAQRKVRSVRPNTGKIELTGECEAGSYFLLDEIDACIDHTLTALRNKVCEDFRVVGLGFSTFVMNLIALDQNGNGVGEEATISYACNAPRVADECQALRRELGDDRLYALYQRTGAPVHSAYALAQLRALYSDPRHQELCKTIHTWTTLATICLARWKGTPSFSLVSYSEASWTGLFNFRTCEWEKDALALLPPQCRASLPFVAEFSSLEKGVMEYMGEGMQVQNPYWDRWPELRGAPDNQSAGCRLYLGLGDGVCANIGTKCSIPSRIAVTIGTSAAARVCLPLPCVADSADNETSFVVPTGLWCYRVNGSHVVLGGALTDGGSVVEWACNLLNLKSEAQFRQCMNEVEALMEVEQPPSVPLIVVPFLGGERSTGYRDGANGCIMGLTRETTSAHFLKGCLEGVILRLVVIVELLREAARDDSFDQTLPTLVVSGVALETNALWRQMLADASGLQVQLDADIQEGTSRGVARLIATSLAQGNVDDASMSLAEEMISSPTVSLPRQSATDGYWAKLCDAQRKFIDAVSPLWLK